MRTPCNKPEVERGIGGAYLSPFCSLSSSKALVTVAPATTCFWEAHLPPLPNMRVARSRKASSGQPRRTSRRQPLHSWQLVPKPTSGERTRTWRARIAGARDPGSPRWCRFLPCCLHTAGGGEVEINRAGLGNSANRTRAAKRRRLSRAATLVSSSARRRSFSSRTQDFGGLHAYRRRASSVPTGRWFVAPGFLVYPGDGSAERSLGSHPGVIDACGSPICERVCERRISRQEVVVPCAPLVLFSCMCAYLMSVQLQMPSTGIQAPLLLFTFCAIGMPVVPLDFRSSTLWVFFFSFFGQKYF